MSKNRFNHKRYNLEMNQDFYRNFYTTIAKPIVKLFQFFKLVSFEQTDK